MHSSTELCGDQFHRDGYIVVEAGLLLPIALGHAMCRHGDEMMFLLDGTVTW